MASIPIGTLAFTFNFTGSTHVPVIYISPSNGGFLAASGSIRAGGSDNISSDIFVTTNDDIFLSCPSVTLKTNFSSAPYRPNGGITMRSNYIDRWYGITQDDSTDIVTINAISATGSLLQSWNLGIIIGSGGSHIHPTTIAVNQSNDIAYLTFGTNPSATASQRKKILRYDLINSVFLTDLASDPTFVTENTAEQSLLVLRNGEILAGWETPTTGPCEIRHYAANGTLLHTYTINPSFTDAPNLASALDDSSFWVTYYGPSIPGLYSRASQIKISDGSHITDLVFSIAQKAEIDAANSCDWQPDLGCFITKTVCGGTSNDCSGGALPGSAGSDSPNNDPGCVNCTPGGALPPDLPSFFSGLLIGAGATTCWDIGIINAILGGMQSNGFYPQVNSSGQARGRFYKDSPTNYDMYADTNHGCQWAWIPHGF